MFKGILFSFDLKSKRLVEFYSLVTEFFSSQQKIAAETSESFKKVGATGTVLSKEQSLLSLQNKQCTVSEIVAHFHTAGQRIQSSQAQSGQFLTSSQCHELKTTLADLLTEFKTKAQELYHELKDSEHSLRKLEIDFKSGEAKLAEDTKEYHI